MAFDLTALFHAGDKDISLYLYQLNHPGQASFANFIPHCPNKNCKYLGFPEIFN